MNHPFQALSQTPSIDLLYPNSIKIPDTTVYLVLKTVVQRPNSSSCTFRCFKVASTVGNLSEVIALAPTDSRDNLLNGCYREIHQYSNKDFQNFQCISRRWATCGQVEPGGGCCHVVGAAQ